MKHNHPIWEGHKFNTYKTKKECYNNTSDEEARIRGLHDKQKNNPAPLNEWTRRPMASFNSSLGKLVLPKDNHGLARDKHGMVVDPLGNPSRLVKNENVTKFVQDIQGWEKRFQNLHNTK
jgi:hypothetical protein